MENQADIRFTNQLMTKEQMAIEAMETTVVALPLNRSGKLSRR
jgi:hypothetical protein